MQTTVNINDALLIEAEQLAAKRQQTLESLLESALRQFLDSNANGSSVFQLRKHTFRGHGLQSGATEGDWNALRTRIYEGRGG